MNKKSLKTKKKRKEILPLKAELYRRVEISTGQLLWVRINSK